MSLSATSFVWNVSGLTSSQKLVLLAIADHSNDDGFAFPSRERIAERCGLSMRQTMRVLAQLEELGYIRRQRDDRPGRGRSRVFFMTLDQCHMIDSRPTPISPQTAGNKIDDITMTPIPTPTHDTDGTHLRQPARTRDTGDINRVAKPGPIAGKGDISDSLKNEHVSPMTEHMSPATPTHVAGVILNSQERLYNQDARARAERVDINRPEKTGGPQPSPNRVRGGGPKQAGSFLPAGYKKGIAEIRAALNKRS